MKLTVVAASVVGLLTCISSVADVPPSCESLSPCVLKENIAVLGSDAYADTLLTAAQTGAQQFERYFGVPALPIAIVPGGTISAELTEQLSAAGFESALPWVSDADKKKLRAASIKKQVLAQTEGLPEAQRQAIVQQALGQSASATEQSDGTMPAEEQGALTHELGHLWFKAAFQSDSERKVTSRHGYGGWAPDWLDETAAILMENETLRAARRKLFSTAAKDGLYPLRDYLTMDHPALASASKLAASFGTAKSLGSRAIVLSGEEAEAFLAESASGDPTKFYTQTQGFIDFMMTRTEDETVFQDIAQHLAASGTLTSWLADRDDMPESIEALEADWAQWLDAR